MEREANLEDILDTVLDIKPGYPPYQIRAMQLRDEITSLVHFVDKKQPKTILEIGTAKGGTFYIWSRYLKSVDKLISLDLPDGKFGGGYDKRKTNIFEEFAPSKDMEFIRENSHSKDVLEEVSQIVEGGVDFLFIDGDHTYDGVKQDFQMYSELVSDGGIIALHDIVTHPNDPSVLEKRRTIDDIEDRHLLWGQDSIDCNVDLFWDELTNEFETKEFISHPRQTWAGIGVVQL